MNIRRYLEIWADIDRLLWILREIDADLGRADYPAIVIQDLMQQRRRLLFIMAIEGHLN